MILVVKTIDNFDLCGRFGPYQNLVINLILKSFPHTKLKDKDDKIAFVRKVPSLGPFDSFRPTEQLQLFSDVSGQCVASRNQGQVHSSVTPMQAIPNASRVDLGSPIISAVSGKDPLNLSQFDSVLSGAHLQNDP